MDARDVEVFFDDDLGAGEGGVGLRGVARLPVPDVVRLLLAVGPHQRGIGFERLEGVHDRRQRIVLDLDELDGVGGDVALGGDDRRDLLRLVDDAIHRQHHLLVAHQGRHPGEAGGVEVLAGDDGEDAGQRERLAGVDLRDLRVGVGAAHDVHVDHARQLDIVYVAALAAQEARVFLALDAVAHAAEGLCGSRHWVASAPAVAMAGAACCSRILPAAYWMDLTMLT